MTPDEVARREEAHWRVFHRLSGEIIDLEAEVVKYRELAQSALALNAVLADENRRLRRSREAEAACTGVYPR